MKMIFFAAAVLFSTAAFAEDEWDAGVAAHGIFEELYPCLYGYSLGATAADGPDLMLDADEIRAQCAYVAELVIKLREHGYCYAGSFKGGWDFDKCPALKPKKISQK